MADTSTIPQIGPEHNGMRMTLDDFARAEGRPGHFYELEKATIIVVDVPGFSHSHIVRLINRAFELYDAAHPGQIFHLSGGSQAAMQMPEMQSERHPDLVIYLNPRPVEDEQPWSYWIPDIVIEVVSAGSEERDYRIKREEDLRAGVRLYWIIDPHERTATVLHRRLDTWQERKLDETGKLTAPQLKGFELALTDLFSANR
jgi:Uma2 family endonuclease